MAQDLHHMSLRAFLLPAVGIQADNHLMAGNRSLFLSLGNIDIGQDPGIVRDHKAGAAVLLKQADHRFIGPL